MMLKSGAGWPFGKAAFIRQMHARHNLQLAILHSVLPIPSGLNQLMPTVGHVPGVCSKTVFATH